MNSLDKYLKVFWENGMFWLWNIELKWIFNWEGLNIVS